MVQAVKPGNRVEARCTRCKDITGHVIIVLLEGRIAKVECCACGSIHKYYPAEKQRVKAASSGGQEKKERFQSPRQGKAGQGTKGKRQSPVDLAQARWHAALENCSATQAKIYALDMQIGQGDLVEHPLFGLGRVMTTQGPNKAEVIFKDGTRLLRCQC